MGLLQITCLEVIVLGNLRQHMHVIQDAVKTIFGGTGNPKSMFQMFTRTQNCRFQMLKLLRGCVLVVHATIYFLKS
jgi:hypothetical protein